jgi:hypothetical protein
MRLALLALAVTVAGCAVDAEEEDTVESSEAISADMQAGSASVLPESIQILHGNGRDYCTGVLVKPRVVVGAAHCIWGTDYTIKAPFAAGSPSRKVVKTGVLSHDANNPASRDIGFFVLDRAIDLAKYPVLTSIGAQVDAGQTFKGVAVGRKYEARTAPLVRSKTVNIKSGKSAGYTNGLRTETYSEGGDSGGPLFLVEDGKITHKLVGIERQPEPARNIDWFTRIDQKSIDMVNNAL